MTKHPTAKRDEAGFTLIELLIVIIILGVLAAIVVFAIGSTRDDAVANACKTDLNSMELSAEAYNTKNGEYPATEAGLLAEDEDGEPTGGLLKSLPESDDYTLTYAEEDDGEDFSITIANDDDAPVDSCDDL